MYIQEKEYIMYIYIYYIIIIIIIIMSRTLNLASEVPFSFKEFGIPFHNLPAE